MGIDEQKEEREVLDSIFPDEITDISDTSYRISIALDVQNDSNGDEEPPEAPIIILNVVYPEQYPDVGPHLDLSSAPNAPKHPLLDIAEDKIQLLDALQTTIEESLGMAMVFTLVATLKEAAETLIADRQSAAQAVRDSVARQAEEEANRRFHGTMVTKERFLEWRAQFTAEMEEREKKVREDEEADEKKRRGGRVEEKKLTGKQLWERGLVGKGDGDEEGLEADDTAATTAGVEKLKVEA